MHSKRKCIKIVESLKHPRLCCTHFEAKPYTHVADKKLKTKEEKKKETALDGADFSIVYFCTRIENFFLGY